MKLSISEIISKRFKNKIKVYQATSPSEVERMIIRPPEAANEFDNSMLTFLNDPKAKVNWSEMFKNGITELTDDAKKYMRYKQNRIINLAKRVRASFPTSFYPEASPTELLNQVHRGKLIPEEKTITLAQTPKTGGR